MYGTVEFKYWITLSTKHLLNESGRYGIRLSALILMKVFLLYMLINIQQSVLENENDMVIS